MKKVIFYIVIPLLTLLFAVLNAILLFPSVSDTAYKSKNGDVTTEIRIVDEVYFIKIIGEEGTAIEDFGLFTDKDEFVSQKTGAVNADLRAKNVFCLQYKGENMYNAASIALEVFYDVMILAGIGAVLYALIRPFKKPKTKK